MVATKTTKPAPAPAKKTPVSLAEAMTDKALKKRYQDAMVRFRKASTDQTARWDERYEVLDEIMSATPPYYLAGGYSSASRFMKAEVPNESERAVKMAIRVARAFDPQDEQRYGISNLDALLSYLEAQSGSPAGRKKVQPARQKIRVGTGSDAKLVPFAQATREQIKAATRAALGKPAAGAKLPPIVVSLKRALSAAGLGEVAVSVRGGKVALSGIAVESLAALAKALKSVRP